MQDLVVGVVGPAHGDPDHFIAEVVEVGSDLALETAPHACGDQSTVERVNGTDRDICLGNGGEEAAVGPRIGDDGERQAPGCRLSTRWRLDEHLRLPVVALEELQRIGHDPQPRCCLTGRRRPE